MRTYKYSVNGDIKVVETTIDTDNSIYSSILSNELALELVNRQPNLLIPQKICVSLLKEINTMKFIQNSVAEIGLALIVVSENGNPIVKSNFTIVTTERLLDFQQDAITRFIIRTLIQHYGNPIKTKLISLDTIYTSDGEILVYKYIELANVFNYKIYLIE